MEIDIGQIALLDFSINYEPNGTARMTCTFNSPIGEIAIDTDYRMQGEIAGIMSKLGLTHSNGKSIVLTDLNGMFSNVKLICEE